ncbi:MAG: putative toxin-antitoxin system toxin component, PIN family [Bryobacteraceae bacterium]
MLRVTADTNVIISGLNFENGKPHQFLQLARAGKINMTISGHILAEVEDILARQFHWPPDDIAEAIVGLKAMARTVRPNVQLDVIKEDPDDDRILECAVSAGSDYIVTGDNDLLRLRSYDAIRILNVADFLELQRGYDR